MISVTLEQIEGKIEELVPKGTVDMNISALRKGMDLYRKETQH